MFRTNILSISIFIFRIIEINLYSQDVNTQADVNQDGVVNILDLTLIAKYLGYSLDTIQDVNPDVNDDGVVNILDLVYVVSMFSSIDKTQETLVFCRGGDSVTLYPSQVLDGESVKVCDMIFDTLVQYNGCTMGTISSCSRDISC